MAAKPSPKPRMPRATNSSLMSDRCGRVPSTRNLLETSSVAQSLDGILRLKGSLRFPAVKFRLAMRSRASGARLALPARGERVGGEGAYPLGWDSKDDLKRRCQKPQSSESRRGPSPSLRIADPSDRRSLLQERRPEDAYALPARGER